MRATPDTGFDALSASPQSLEITRALLARGRQQTLHECLDAELTLTRTTIRTPDFLEGVRVALADKDRSPPGNVRRRADRRCWPEHLRREQVLRADRGEAELAEISAWFDRL
ncbi:enoyl-CoA hydratase/isomerase family protein [Streptomyces sp. NPDC001480]|uniref:enoyl-CoA hydratase/isomerase family protein n=1 Tax=Streptomyces sp. NPDC001480 TaxID=3364577 RepID=UPI0036ADD553